MRKLIIISTIAILMFSICSIMAEEQNVNTDNIIVGIKSLGYNKSYNRHVVQVNIVNIPISGKNRLSYIEEYYSKDKSEETEEMMRDGAILHFDQNITEGNISFIILRPLTKSGEAYPLDAIRAIVLLDNKTIMNKRFMINKEKLKKESSGFGMPELVIIMSIVCLLKISKRIY